MQLIVVTIYYQLYTDFYSISYYLFCVVDDIVIRYTVDCL